MICRFISRSSQTAAQRRERKIKKRTLKHRSFPNDVIFGQKIPTVLQNQNALSQSKVPIIPLISNLEFLTHSSSKNTAFDINLLWAKGKKMKNYGKRAGACNEGKLLLPNAVHFEQCKLRGKRQKQKERGYTAMFILPPTIHK